MLRALLSQRRHNLRKHDQRTCSLNRNLKDVLFSANRKAYYRSFQRVPLDNNEKKGKERVKERKLFTRFFFFNSGLLLLSKGKTHITHNIVLLLSIDNSLEQGGPNVFIQHGALPSLHWPISFPRQAHTTFSMNHSATSRLPRKPQTRLVIDVKSPPSLLFTSHLHVTAAPGGPIMSNKHDGSQVIYEC